jgi:hypothetical protein
MNSNSSRFFSLFFFSLFCVLLLSSQNFPFLPFSSSTSSSLFVSAGQGDYHNRIRRVTSFQLPASMPFYYTTSVYTNTSKNDGVVFGITCAKEAGITTESAYAWKYNIETRTPIQTTPITGSTGTCLSKLMWNAEGLLFSALNTTQTTVRIPASDLTQYTTTLNSDDVQWFWIAPWQPIGSQCGVAGAGSSDCMGGTCGGSGGKSRVRWYSSQPLSPYISRGSGTLPNWSFLSSPAMGGCALPNLNPPVFMMISDLAEVIPVLPFSSSFRPKITLSGSETILNAVCDETNNFAYALTYANSNRIYKVSPVGFVAVPNAHHFTAGQISADGQYLYIVCDMSPGLLVQLEIFPGFEHRKTISALPGESRFWSVAVTGSHAYAFNFASPTKVVVFRIRETETKTKTRTLIVVVHLNNHLYCFPRVKTQ